MRKRAFLGTVILFTFLIMIASPVLVRADVYIKLKRHTDAYQVMGQTQPEKDEIIITWMGKDKGKIDTGEDQSMIILLDKKMMYFLDHAKKTYSEMPFGDLSEILSSALPESELSEEEMAMAKKFMKGITSSMMKFEAKVTDTGEKKTIKGWKCRKYIMNVKMMMGGSTSEIWATEDIKINFDLYRTLGFSIMAKQPGFQEVMKEMEKIKGVAVLTTSTSSAMGADVKMTDEITEVKEESAPSGAYEVPKDYVKAKETIS